MHWFLTEQREEVASMTQLLTIVERGRENLLAVEEYLGRMQVGDQGAPDAAAPPAAGGFL